MECSFFVAGRTLLFTASRVFKKLFLVGLITAAFNDFPAFAVKGGEVSQCRNGWLTRVTDGMVFLPE